LVAIPLGRTADKFGRKKVLASSLLGSVTGLLWILVVCLFATLAIVDMCLTVRKADIADILYRQFLFGLPDSFGQFGYPQSSIFSEVASPPQTPWSILWLLIAAQSRTGKLSQRINIHSLKRES
jgi:MFS family permease